VLFVIPGFARGSTFVETDRAILARHFETTTLVREAGDRLFGARVARHLRRHDVAVAWFADTHADAAVRWGRRLGKPVAVIPGQYEFVAAPEGPYGLALESPRRYRQACRVVSECDLVPAVSEYHAGLVRGAQAHPAPVRVLYHGFDDTLYGGAVAKEPLVVTVTHVGSRARIWHKGLETFARAAAGLPGARFALAGGYDEGLAGELQELAQGRLEFTGALPPAEVARLLGRAAVYCQLSATETFGCALAEAMLCECVPVVTNRGALPEVAGEVGFYTEYGDVEGTVAQIRRALISERGAAARRRIQEKFPLEKRERGLVEAVGELARRGASPPAPSPGAVRV
jgi:glycosyltransferase involved in cell wall biosynthesis